MRFCVEGEWRTVAIDTRIPCTASGSPAFSHSALRTLCLGALPCVLICVSVSLLSAAHELWVMALEKGYAKLTGTYDRLVGGLVHVALVDMTGGFGEEMYGGHILR